MADIPRPIALVTVTSESSSTKTILRRLFLLCIPTGFHRLDNRPDVFGNKIFLTPLFGTDRVGLI